MKRELWKIENYREFLAARRELLAEAANSFLNGLLTSSVSEIQQFPYILEREVAAFPIELADEADEKAIHECNEWVQQQGLPQGELMYELADATTGEAIAVFDLAWSNGLQEGKSQPVALLISENKDIEEAANRAGYRYFTNIEVFQQYVQIEILAIAN